MQWLTRHIPLGRFAASLAFLLVGLSTGSAAAQGASSPDALLGQWRAALEVGDFAAYTACLHPQAREVPEYGSAEAMAFWADEMGDLARDGFEGHFELEVVGEGDARFPAGAVRAHPIVNGVPLSDAITLVEEAGQWMILRIFS